LQQLRQLRSIKLLITSEGNKRLLDAAPSPLIGSFVIANLKEGIQYEVRTRIGKGDEKVSVADQLRKLDEQRTEILEKAKKDLLDKAAAAIEELNSLGFSYGLIEGKSQVKKTGKRNTDPSKKHCPICDMDGHDGRAHRGQGKTKKKFTAAELKELGL
jgi:hypothetical protein